MIVKLPNHINKLIIAASLLLFSFFASSLYGQEEIGGIVNRYAKVTSVGSGYVIVSVAQAAQFQPEDYVLLIQMQGVGIQTIQGSYGVNVQSVFGTPGGYEFLKVLSVNYGTGRIDFTRNVFINTYDVASNVQIVQVPFYSSPTVVSNLSAQPWNSASGTGGVIAIMAARKLTLDADIDASGLGFRGAPGVFGIGQCVYANIPANSLDSYPDSYNNAGFKGEGVAIHDLNKNLLYPGHAKGQGRNFTGGGGGNGWFPGGGGGSNRGKGGDGGLEKFVMDLCGNDPHEGGYGGMNILGTIIQNGIFQGGGGGASTQAEGSSASPGGNGGGIVIIVADTIDGRNHFIKANGNSAANSLSDAGAGGGGAGGSVAVSFRNYSGQLQITADGGNGGTNTGGFGYGGGGGGGLIWVSGSTISPMITGASVQHGMPAPTTPSEGNGEIKYNYIPRLNGFLFNSIWSAATGNKTDSVCSNVLYGQIAGTNPVGGTPPYTYRWESSTTSATSGFSTAPGVSGQQNYTPSGLLTQTTWFRRVVTDNGGITDISVPVRIIVHPHLTNNVIGSPDTLCYGQHAQTLVPVQTIQGGSGIYGYTWQSSSNNTDWADIQGTGASCLPPDGLTATTWFRRLVRSGACSDISAPVRINVLDTVRNNSIITLPQEICAGMAFTALSATTAPTLGGGDGTYSFRWESSSDGNTWAAAIGVNNASGYDPDESASYFPGQQYFRRVVMSGSNDVCVNKSRPVLLNSYPAITGNTVASDQTICAGTVPVPLNGSVPHNGKGEGSYSYTWQDSSKFHSWADIPGYVKVTSGNFAPPVLTDTMRYRRIVYSSACTDISKPVIINVHKPITGNTVSLPGGLADTTVCNGAIPHLLVGTTVTGGTGLPGDYTYQWSSSSDNVVWEDIAQAATSRDFQPQMLSATTWFRRRAVSGQCFSESLPVKITVLPSIINNTIASGQTVCKSDIPSPLAQAGGLVLSGGSGSYSYLWEQSIDGTSWVPAAGTNNLDDGTYHPPAMTRTMKYRRNVTSGANNCCRSVSNVLELVLDSLPSGASINAGPDTIIYSFDHIVGLAADPPFTGGSGRWTVLKGSGSFNDDTDNDTKVTGLTKGLNTFLWTVTRGACKLEDEVDVTIVDMFIPEGFSPNNDPEGYNNKFIIKGLDLQNQEAEMRIINGAGAEVFHTSNRNGSEWTDWDGKNSRGTDLPEGTYYYLLTLKSKSGGQVFRKSGFVVLKRY